MKYHDISWPLAGMFFIIILCRPSGVIKNAFRLYSVANSSFFSIPNFLLPLVKIPDKLTQAPYIPKPGDVPSQAFFINSIPFNGFA